MASDQLDRPSSLPPDFQQAAQPAAAVEPPKVMVSLPIDADVLAYFQSEAEPSDWQRHINDLLRYYMETNQMMEADAELAARAGELEPAPSL